MLRGDPDGFVLETSSLWAVGATVCAAVMIRLRGSLVVYVRPSLPLPERRGKEKEKERGVFALWLLDQSLSPTMQNLSLSASQNVFLAPSRP